MSVDGVTSGVRVSAADVPPREGRKLLVNGREIALFNLGDRFLAVDNQCPHKGGPLADGIVSGHAVVCPLHAWKIDLETGSVQRPAGESGCVRAYATRTEGRTIVIDLESAGAPLNTACSGATAPPSEVSAG
jgi:nitrite reductase (NADH) small subunit